MTPPNQCHHTRTDTTLTAFTARAPRFVRNLLSNSGTYCDILREFQVSVFRKALLSWQRPNLPQVRHHNGMILFHHICGSPSFRKLSTQFWKRISSWNITANMTATMRRTKPQVVANSISRVCDGWSVVRYHTQSGIIVAHKMKTRTPGTPK